MKFKVYLSIFGKTWERAMVWVVSSMRVCQEGFCTTAAALVKASHYKCGLFEFCTWTCPILICINIYRWPGKSPTKIAASLLSKCILLSYPFLFPVVVSGMKFSCCCSCQQHYLEINITVARVYINTEWRTWGSVYICKNASRCRHG